MAASSLLIDNGYTTIVFATTFSEHSQTTHEAQAAVGDSGGGVFQKDGTTWELTGIMGAIGTFVGQPSQTAIFENVTYSAQLANYRSEIIALRADTACSNGIDDDGDGEVDFPDDPGCLDADDLPAGSVRPRPLQHYRRHGL